MAERDLSEAPLKCGRQRVMAGNMVWQAARYGYGMQRVMGMGMGMQQGMGMGTGYGRYG